MSNEVKKALKILKEHSEDLTQGQGEFYRSCQRQIRRENELSERQISILAEISTEIKERHQKSQRPRRRI